MTHGHDHHHAAGERVAAPPAVAPPTSGVVEYTCPMHPEVRQSGPVPARSAAWLWSRVAVAPVQTHDEWTCPMHPEIVRDEPGSCPICGMALEPRTRAPRRRHNPELPT